MTDIAQNYNWNKVSKILPPINTSVLICTNLAAGGECYDVACFLGKQANGALLWMCTDVEIAHKDIIAWKSIEPFLEEKN